MYDDANRLEQLNGQQVYSFDDNGNLLNSDTLTNTWDAANRLTQTQRDDTILEPIYNGVGDRVGQTIELSTTHFALDVQGLPEVIYTSEGNAYLHLPGVIVAESSTGETRYLLSDGLGSVRQAVDENGTVVAYNEFDPYGNPLQNDSDPYGFTGEWWEDEVSLLHLRARWYAPETGTFLSVDAVESEPPYQYVRGNPVNKTDPSGMTPLPSNSCQACLPKGKLNNGYSESVVTSFTFLRPLRVIAGTEVVFDFATLEIAEFEPTLESTPSSAQFDIGLISYGTVYQWSVISGFESEPNGNLQREYMPSIVNYSLGLSLGSLISLKGGVQNWEAENFSLLGAGYWYGSELAGLDWISLSPPFTEVTAITGVPVNLSYYKSSTIYRYGGDFGEVCNPEDADKFLTALETWPYPLTYAGLYLGRLSAISNFKRYAGID